EESGAVVALGSWVLDTALTDLAGELANHSVTMSVNVSARQLADPGLVRAVEDALARSCADPRRLVIELTETAAIADAPATLARLVELRKLGVQVALDDFGTGYSSLTYLRRFPIDYLKIDRSFTAGIAESQQDEAIVRGVIEMAHALSIQAVAEGVETVEQRDALASWGCDYGQGYLWRAPAPLLDRTESCLSVPAPRASATLDRCPRLVR
ncbi:MAG: EAL domain-containing protein, partial [Mycobacteriales bacterium]